MNEPVLNISNLAFVEGMLEQFQRDPSSVPAEWRGLLAELTRENPNAQLRPRFKPSSLFNPPAAAADTEEAGFLPGSAHATSIKDRVIQMIRACRFRGHIIAHLDPLGQP